MPDIIYDVKCGVISFLDNLYFYAPGLLKGKCIF